MDEIEVGMVPEDIKALIFADKAARAEAAKYGDKDEYWANLFLRHLDYKGFKIITVAEYRELTSA